MCEHTQLQKLPARLLREAEVRHHPGEAGAEDDREAVAQAVAGEFLLTGSTFNVGKPVHQLQPRTQNLEQPKLLFKFVSHHTVPVKRWYKNDF